MLVHLLPVIERKVDDFFSFASLLNLLVPNCSKEGMLQTLCHRDTLVRVKDKHPSQKVDTHRCTGEEETLRQVTGCRLTSRMGILAGKVDGFPLSEDPHIALRVFLLQLLDILVGRGPQNIENHIQLVTVASGMVSVGEGQHGTVIQ